MDLGAASNCLGKIGYGNSKLYKGYINLLLYEIMHHSKMIMITCVMKAKENTCIFFVI